MNSPDIATDLVKYARSLAKIYNACEISLNHVIVDIRNGYLRNKEEVKRRMQRLGRPVR